MTENLTRFTSIWGYWMFLSLILAFIGTGMLIYWQYGKSRNNRKIAKIGSIFFGQAVITFIIGFGAFSAIQSQSREELKMYLKQDDLILKVNDQELNKIENQKFLNIIRKIVTILPHHSSPTKEIRVEIISSIDTTILSLEQDSEIEDEYWIFWNKYDYNNDIGRLKTSELNEYLPSK